MALRSTNHYHHHHCWPEIEPLNWPSAVFSAWWQAAGSFERHHTEPKWLELVVMKSEVNTLRDDLKWPLKACLLTMAVFFFLLFSRLKLLLTWKRSKLMRWSLGQLCSRVANWLDCCWLLDIGGWLGANPVKLANAEMDHHQPVGQKWGRSHSHTRWKGYWSIWWVQLFRSRGCGDDGAAGHSSCKWSSSKTEMYAGHQVPMT